MGWALVIFSCYDHNKMFVRVAEWCQAWGRVTCCLTGEKYHVRCISCILVAGLIGLRSHTTILSVRAVSKRHFINRRGLFNTFYNHNIIGLNQQNMTVSYTGDVANASEFGCFNKILLKWKGSVYKLIYKVNPSLIIKPRNNVGYSRNCWPILQFTWC